MRIIALAFAAACLCLPAVANAADGTLLQIHDKQFEPARLQLPAGVKLKLVVRNLNKIPAEFESYDLSREVVVPGHGEITVYVGPLDPGSYRFFNDFDHGMQGTIEAVPSSGQGD